jgi:WD40 repeat protein
LVGHDTQTLQLAFSPDGKRLVAGCNDGSVRVWPLDGSSGERSRTLYQFEGVRESAWRLAVAADGSFVVAGTANGLVVVIPFDGGPVRRLGEAGFDAGAVRALAVGPRSRLAAAGSRTIVRLWNLESDEVRALDAGDGERIQLVEFTEGGDLLVGSGHMLRRWSLNADQPSVAEEIDLQHPEFVSDSLCAVDLVSRRALLRQGEEDGDLWIMDIDTREAYRLTSHPTAARCGLHGNGELVSSTDLRGELRIGPATGEEPYLLLGHKDEVNAFAVSPDGRWIASGGDDATIRLWPMPDLSKPPLHTLPREELIAKLKTLTNLRAVPDDESPTGWKFEADPFPGWETVPSW